MSVPVERIKEVISELSELQRKNLEASKVTRDEWFKGVVHAYGESKSMLESLVNEHVRES